jgi:hypothetical protein
VVDQRFQFVAAPPWLGNVVIGKKAAVFLDEKARAKNVELEMRAVALEIQLDQTLFIQNRFAELIDRNKKRLSGAAIEKRRAALQGFEARWKQLNPRSWPIPQQVDYRLIGSALARVHWELEINPRWKRDPIFYLEQTLTPVVEALTVPAPYGEARSREILTRIENIPAILESATASLTNPPAPFASVTVQALEKIRPRLQEMAAALQPLTTLKEAELIGATERAADALENFRKRLQEIEPSLPNETALGRDAYVFFLKNVALLPYSPEELLAMGRQEWDRAVTFEAFEAQRNRNVPPLVLATDVEGWKKDTAAKESAIRDFLETHRILTVPDWMQHYTLRAMPAFVVNRVNNSLFRHQNVPYDNAILVGIATAPSTTAPSTTVPIAAAPTAAPSPSFASPAWEGRAVFVWPTRSDRTGACPPRRQARPSMLRGSSSRSRSWGWPRVLRRTSGTRGRRTQGPRSARTGCPRR